jgi:hypothetical protein
MTPSFVVYVDESGDEGFQFSKGSSEWLVLSASIFRKATEPQDVKLVNDVCKLLGKSPQSGLHFRLLKHDQRVPYIARIASTRTRTISVLVHKPSLREPEVFREKSRLYIYSVRYLLERVSWFCREKLLRGDPGDGSAEIIFSNRSSTSYGDIRDYRKNLQAKDTQIHWPAIRPDQVYPLPHKQRFGLQIADAIASSFYLALQTNRFGFTEDRFARMLRPIVWRRGSSILAYGLKIWPKEAEAALDYDGSHKWIRECYQ